MKKYFLIAVSLIFLAGCQTQKEDPAEDNGNTVVEENVDASYSPAEDVEWQEFFKEFQEAVKAGDMTKLQSMVYNETLGPDFVEDYSIHFEDESGDEILKMSADDAEVIEDFWLDTTGEVIGQALMMGYSYEDGVQATGVNYYFFKIDGKYKLVQLLAVG